jgi:hypothetical protein
VTSRGNGRAAIFWTDDDRLRFLTKCDLPPQTNGGGSSNRETASRTTPAAFMPKRAWFQHSLLTLMLLANR